VPTFPATRPADQVSAAEANRGDKLIRLGVASPKRTPVFISEELELEEVPLNESHNEPPEAPLPRLQRLSQLIERYELGAVTHQEFEQIKKGILLGESHSPSHRSPQTEMIVATYSQSNHLDGSLQRILTLPKESQDAIIDGALLLRARSGTVRIRSIAGLTRTPETNGMSVIICLCSLLFEPRTIQIDSNQAGWSQSLGHMGRHGIVNSSLKKLGEGVPNGSQSISVVYWSSRADEIAASFMGFDDFARRILDDAVVDALTEVLIQLPER